MAMTGTLGDGAAERQQAKKFGGIAALLWAC